jgi:probable RNA-binding protein EIF1AD
VLHDFPEPDPDDRIAKVVATRGGNQFDVLLESTAKGEAPVDDRKAVLAMLPTKFRKLVWLKRNDFVIVRTGGGQDEDATTGNDGNDSTTKGIRFIVTHILYKDQVKNLQVKGLWPVNDPEFSIEGMAEPEIAHDGQDVDDNVDVDDDDGIVYDTGMGDDEIFVNRNRAVGAAAVPDSSDSEDDD